MGLSNRIRKIRESRNETMEEFGLNNFNPPASKGVVSNWENGYNKPNKKRLDAIAKLGEMSTEELLHGEYVKCDFCTGEDYITKNNENMPDISVTGENLLIDGDNMILYVGINFCPMCGCRLNDSI